MPFVSVSCPGEHALTADMPVRGFSPILMQSHDSEPFVYISTSPDAIATGQFPRVLRSVARQLFARTRDVVSYLYSTSYAERTTAAIQTEPLLPVTLVNLRLPSRSGVDFARYTRAAEIICHEESIVTFKLGSSFLR